MDKFLKSVVRVMKWSAQGFNHWRLKQKLLGANLPLEDDYMKYLALYRETKDFTYLKKYNEEYKRLRDERYEAIFHLIKGNQEIKGSGIESWWD